MGKGNKVGGPARKRQRTRRHRHLLAGLVLAVEGQRHRPGSVLNLDIHPLAPPQWALHHHSPPVHHRASLASHPPRVWGSPDTDGLFDVHSRRFGRPRTPPRSPMQGAPRAGGIVFQVLAQGSYTSKVLVPARCYKCGIKGHRARDVSPACTLIGGWSQAWPLSNAAL